ncbi:unnamed protein product [Ascophyllum nodosum]
MVSRDRNSHQAASDDEVSARRGRAAASAEGGAPESTSYSIMQNTFRVDPRYSGLKAVGKGSFGIVCSALDSKQGKRVAIKKIHPMASHVVDAKHVLREVRLMRYLGVHPNIVTLEDLFVREHHDELYIVMELLDSDLHRIIQSPQPLGDAHHRYFMFQLLKGVKFLHENRIIHRDLKPGNILVTKNCQLRITDFGLARLRPMGKGIDPDDEVDHPMTEHVVTRWYRPPELMLCPDGLYGYAVDVWSIGCIFAELLGRRPLFAGKNFMDQLTLIFGVLGPPEPHEVAHIRNSQAKKFLESMKTKAKVPFREMFPSASEQAVDFLEGLLVFDPPGRLSVPEALEHPYFQPLRKTDTHPASLEVPSDFEFEFESKPLCGVQLKSMILKEVESFQREQRLNLRRASSSSTSTSCLGGAGSGAKVTRASTSSATASSAAVVDEEQSEASEKGDNLEEQHQQLQDRLRKRRGGRQVAPLPAGSSANRIEAGGKRERERAPISAVSSTQIVRDDVVAPRAVALRKGLGSCEDVSRSHRETEGSKRAAGQEGSDAALGAESMDDDEDSSEATPVGENIVLSPGNPPFTPELQGRPYVSLGGRKSGSRDRHRSSGGGKPKVVSSMTANKRWCQAETLARSSGNAANNGLRPRYYTKAPQPPVDRSRKQTRNGGVSEKTQVSLGSPVDIRRSADGVAAGERPWVMPWWGRGGGGNDRAGGVGARGGPWEKDPAAEQYQVPPPSYQDKHPIGQELQQQQQQQQIWGKNISAVHEVEDRFHRLNFERARQGRRVYDDVWDPSVGMRAPQR